MPTGIGASSDFFAQQGRETNVSGGQVRKAAEDRIDEIVRATAAGIVRNGALPSSMSQIAKDAGVSRTLLYLYFPDPQTLVDEVAFQELGKVWSLIKALGPARGSDRTWLIDLGHAYLDYLLKEGPLLRYVMRDLHSVVVLSPRSMTLRNAVLRRLFAAARHFLALPASDAFILIELLSSIPEELANLVRQGELERALAEETCSRLLCATFAAIPGQRTP